MRRLIAVSLALAGQLVGRGVFARATASTRRTDPKRLPRVAPKIVFISLFTLTACVSQPSRAPTFPEPITEIPYQIDYEGWVTIQATVNGEGPYDFIVDSGATITSVFENLAQSQNFQRAERLPIRILGLTSAQRLPAFKLGEFVFGGERLENHVGVILPDWRPPRKPPHGVLGLDFLTRYTVHFDADRKVIRLYDPDAPLQLSGARWSGNKLEPDNYGQDFGALYRTVVIFQGRRIDCIVDLGASGTLLNYRTLRRLLSGVFINGSRNTGLTTGTRLNDIFNDTEAARRVRVRRIGIAGARWRNKQFVVFDAPVFEELGVEKKPYCLLGTDLLLDNSFIFDFNNETLYIGPKARP